MSAMLQLQGEQTVMPTGQSPINHDKQLDSDNESALFLRTQHAEVVQDAEEQLSR